MPSHAKSFTSGSWHGLGAVEVRRGVRAWGVKSCLSQLRSRHWLRQLADFSHPFLQLFFPSRSFVRMSFDHLPNDQFAVVILFDTAARHLKVIWRLLHELVPRASTLPPAPMKLCLSSRICRPWSLYMFGSRSMYFTRLAVPVAL